jgi:hypothetical protein
VSNCVTDCLAAGLSGLYKFCGPRAPFEQARLYMMRHMPYPVVFGPCRAPPPKSVMVDRLPSSCFSLSPSLSFPSSPVWPTGISMGMCPACQHAAWHALLVLRHTASNDVWAAAAAASAGGGTLLMLLWLVCTLVHSNTRSSVPVADRRVAACVWSGLAMAMNDCVAAPTCPLRALPPHCFSVVGLWAGVCCDTQALRGQCVSPFAAARQLLGLCGGGTCPRGQLQQPCALPPVPHCSV